MSDGPAGIVTEAQRPCDFILNERRLRLYGLVDGSNSAV